MLKIAICDDNAIQLDIIQEELKKNIKEDISYTIDTFNSEAAFTQILQFGSCPYDIVFMDIVLGDASMSGIDLVHKVNFLNPACQIIYISQYLERIRRYCEMNAVPVSFHHVDSLQKAKELPCVFNNWAIFYKGNFQTVNLPDEATLKRILKK